MWYVLWHRKEEMPWLTKNTDGNFQSLTFWVMIWVSLSNIEGNLTIKWTVTFTVLCEFAPVGPSLILQFLFPLMWICLLLLRSECQGLHLPGLWNVSVKVVCWLQALWGRGQLHQVCQAGRVWFRLSHHFTGSQWVYSLDIPVLFIWSVKCWASRPKFNWAVTLTQDNLFSNILLIENLHL